MCCFINGKKKIVIQVHFSITFQYFTLKDLLTDLLTYIVFFVFLHKYQYLYLSTEYEYFVVHSGGVATGSSSRRGSSAAGSEWALTGCGRDRRGSGDDSWVAGGALWPAAGPPPPPQEEIASSQCRACHPARREEARVFVGALRLSDDSERADNVKPTLTLASPPAGRNKRAVLASRVSAALVIGRLPAASLGFLLYLCPTSSESEEGNRHSAMLHLRKRKSISAKQRLQKHSYSVLK